MSDVAKERRFCRARYIPGKQDAIPVIFDQHDQRDLVASFHTVYRSVDIIPKHWCARPASHGPPHPAQRPRPAASCRAASVPPAMCNRLRETSPFSYSAQYAAHVVFIRVRHKHRVRRIAAADRAINDLIRRMPRFPAVDKIFRALLGPNECGIALPHVEKRNMHNPLGPLSSIAAATAAAMSARSAAAFTHRFAITYFEMTSSTANIPTTAYHGGAATSAAANGTLAIAPDQSGDTTDHRRSRRTQTARPAQPANHTKQCGHKHQQDPGRSHRDHDLHWSGTQTWTHRWNDAASTGAVPAAAPADAHPARPPPAAAVSACVRLSSAISDLPPQCQDAEHRPIRQRKPRAEKRRRVRDQRHIRTQTKAR